jgi:DNA-binding response OmpR family regulator
MIANNTGNALLLVDYEDDILKVVNLYLEREGYRVLTARDGASMWTRLAANDIDLIILDVLLPDANGFALVQDIRKNRDIPIILLTGKAEPVDKVVGLELGADDYLSKPVDLRELLARFRSVLRRCRPTGGPQGDAASGPIKVFSGWTLDQARRELYSPGGEKLELTSSEFDLLCVLVNNAQRPVTRDQMLDATRSRPWTPFDRSIDVSIGRLRKKLEADPGNPALIKTVRNVGYILAASVSGRKPGRKVS